MTEYHELVMNVEWVYQVPYKVVLFEGVIECTSIKAGDKVVISYEGQLIHATIMCLETFNLIHREGKKAQRMCLAFYPTKELRSIKQSYTEISWNDVVKDSGYVFEKSTAVVWKETCNERDGD